MLIIIDKKMPAEAKKHLQNYGEVLELHTSGIVYPTISGHPDIFFCQTANVLVVSPNLPDEYLNILKYSKIKFITGENKLGMAYPFTVHYNAFSGHRFLIHNLKYTDKAILQTTARLIHINVGQGYTRCNLISLNEEIFITSDAGIQRSLARQGLHSKYFSPQHIYLKGFKHGFLGGTCGILDRKIFLCGSLKYHHWAGNFRKITEEAAYEIIELAKRPLLDVGCILFVKNHKD